MLFGQVATSSVRASQADARWVGVHAFAPSPEDVDLFKRAIAEVLAPMGINKLILEVNYRFEYETYPELRGEQCLSREQAHDLAAHCRELGIELIPQFMCLGHQSWANVTFPLLRKHPEFDETPEIPKDNKGIYCRSWCPLHPKVNEIVFSLMDELAGAFEARSFHVGMDEVFLLASEQCSRCKGKDPAKLFARAVRDYHHHLVVEKGLTMLMWGDRLLDDSEMHYGEWESSCNGTAPAIELIPKDIVVCDWHYTERPDYPSIARFVEKGFRVWPASWHDESGARALVGAGRRLDSPLVVGHLFTTWVNRNEFVRAALNETQTPSPEAVALMRTLRRCTGLASGIPHKGPALMNLMPAPRDVVFGEGELELTPLLTVMNQGVNDLRLKAAIERFVKDTSDTTGMPIVLKQVENPDEAVLTIECASSGEPVQSLEEDESYLLQVDSERIRLKADTVVGAMRGLATLSQLVLVGEEAFVIPSVRIEDRPRFPWRGLLLDVCRHWQPMDVVKRTMDGMAAVKLNVLHLHLSEDQGFRVESRLYPKLHQLGSDGHYFSQDEIREIVAYARDRGIRVVPEFDVPGHCASWLVGYPELAAGNGPFEIIRQWGVFDPCLDPTKDSVYAFLDGFIGEMAALFPDAYFHIGGDEVNGKLWDANPAIQQYMQAHGLENNGDLQAYFNRRLCGIVQDHGKIMIGWDEILHGNLPKECVVHSWRGAETLRDAVKQGYVTILSAGYYLDHMMSARYHYLNDPLILAGDVTEQEQRRILGGEACMWSEYVTPEIIDSRIWPRLAVVAERLWSPGDVVSVEDMYHRMRIVSKQLSRLGLQHESNYEPMLRRMVGNKPIEPLKALVDVVEPSKRYARNNRLGYTSFTPMNRVIDASRPESQTALQFNLLAETLKVEGVNRGAVLAELRRQLTLWHENHLQLQPYLRDCFLVREVRPLSARLREVAATGLEALAYLESSGKAPGQWYSRATAILDTCEKPCIEMQLPVISGIRCLVDAAGGR